MLSNATMLIDEAITIDGLKIYGSPVTPQGGGAFGGPSAKERARHRNRILDDVDALVTHGPPRGYSTSLWGSMNMPEIRS